MKNIQIKNFHIPTFLLETLQLENEINETELIIAHLSAKMNRLKEEAEMLEVINETIHQFQSLIPKAFPQIHNNPVAKEMIEELHIANFESFDELMELMAEILFRIFFSEGEDKVFDPKNPKYFNRKKCELLATQGIFLTAKWMSQFVRCLNAKDAKEDMILHNLTPEWLWPRCFRLMMELYKLTGEAIKNKS
ncbi:MAG: hypothetical protein JST26_13065 [Bacteroidetes bacterium]|nr:hypothetical protein [Bacteroidota bacterium]